MSKVVVSNRVTLDGCASGPGGDVMAMPFEQNDSFSVHNRGLVQAAGTLLLGATTYAGMRDYWPPVVDDESQPEVERDIARRNNEIAKVVVSDSMTGDGTDDIVTFGSITLVNDLLAAGLVDELQLLVAAGVLIDGVPAFSRRPARAPQLAEARQLPGTNTALLRYTFE